MDAQVRFERLVARLRVRHLRLVAETVALGSLKLAAEQCGMTQPAASQALHEVERLLDTPLFERGPRGMTPTAAGQSLAAHARGSLGSLNAASRDISQLEAGLTLPLRIGGIAPTVATLMAPALRRLGAQQPGLCMRFIEDSLEPLIEGLSNGSFDLVLLRQLPVEPSGFRFEMLYQDALLAVALPGHPLARRRRATLEDLLAYRWLVPPRPLAVAEALHLWLLRRGLKPRLLPLETNAPSLAPTVLHGTHDVLLAPRSYLLPLLAPRTLVALPVALDLDLAPLGALLPRGTLSEPMRRFLAACRDVT